MTTESLNQKRFGVKRWIVLACIILGAYLQFGPLPTIAPNVFLPGEKIGKYYTLQSIIPILLFISIIVYLLKKPLLSANQK